MRENAASEGKLSDVAIFRRLARQARPYWGRLALLAGLGTASTPMALLGPVPLKITVDSVIGSKPLPGFVEVLLPAFVTESQTALLGAAAGMMVALAILGQLLGLGGDWLRTVTSSRLILDFRSRVFAHAQRLSVGFHDQRGTTDSVLRIQYDTGCVSGIAIDSIIPLVSQIVMLVSMLYVSLLLDWQLALIALVTAPLLFVLARVYGGLLRVRSREAKELHSKATSVLFESLSALRVVKAFGQEDREEQRFIDGSLLGIRANIRLTLLSGGFGLMVSLTTTIALASVLFVGTRHVLAGVTTLGELLMMMSYLTRLLGPVRSINRKLAGIQGHFASAERVFTILDRSPDVPEQSDAEPISRAAGHICLENVSFGYEPGKLILRDVSIDIPTGTKVGIFGETGAGKTTLVNLMIRFCDPTAGRILLDGRDLRGYRLADVREQFSLVLQDPVLFPTSIAENIAYARPHASMEEVVAAAEAAEAHSFITKLPARYDTRVGERGMRLSGGERQRISLARAFLRNSPILVLDEPTSSIDPGTESEILRALERLTEARTTLMIGHRPSTLENCDILVEIRDGQFQEHLPYAQRVQLS